MHIERIITKRRYNKNNAFQLVYEWEDVFKESLNANFSIDFNNVSMAKHFGKLYSMLPLTTRKPSLLLEMNPKDRVTLHNNKLNIIPLIIDFYYASDEDLARFYSSYDKHKLVLISSIEVFEFLKSRRCPLNIAHLPLSISDKYKISADTVFEKRFDILLMGRQNPVLNEYLKRYLEKHSNISVVSCTLENGHYNYYDQWGGILVMPMIEMDA